MALTWLHLSDWHQTGKEFRRDKLRDALVKDIEERAERISPAISTIDFVVFSGDIAFCGKKEEYQAAITEFFDPVLKAAGIASDHLFVVPGNHDISRNYIYEMLPVELQQPIGTAELVDKWLMDDVKRLRTLEPFKEYRSFIADYTGQDSPDYASAMKMSIDDKQIALLGLNSAWMCARNKEDKDGRDEVNDYGRLVLGNPQLYCALEKAKGAQVVIGVIHHPFEWLTMTDALPERSQIKEQLIKGCHFILHGHEHEPNVSIPHGTGGDCMIISAGSSYVRADPATSRYAHGYNIVHLDFATGKGVAYLRRYDERQGWILDNGTTGDKKPGYSEFVLPKDLCPNPSSAPPPLVALAPMSFRGAMNDKANLKIEVDPVPLATEWVGRKQELESLRTSGLRAVAITGVGGQGKSALAAEFLRRYTRGSDALFGLGVWVDCRELPDSLHMKLMQVLEVLSDGKETAIMYRDEKIVDTAKRLLQRMQDNPILIVLDNIDAYVDSNTESIKDELKPLLNIILNSDHQSLVIFTCRQPFYDSRGSFYSIQLRGLDENDGIEYFQKRDIKLIGDNAEKYCKEIIKLTNGHPWWLGLIAGQVKSKAQTFKSCAEQMSKGENVSSKTIQEYFKGIWSQLTNDRQKLLRYFVEAPRPLTENEICQIAEDFGPKKTRKEIRRLERIGLIEPHEDVSSNSEVFQVHPLVREFVHEHFTIANQKLYVTRILYLFLPQSVVNALFSNINNESEISFTSSSDLTTSIETCLNSRNYMQCLKLLINGQDYLFNGSYYHQVLSLGCRAIDSINWKEPMLNQLGGAALLNKITKLLFLFGEKSRSDLYLKRWESCINKNMPEYCIYLDTVAYLAWIQGNYKKSIQYADEHDEILKKIGIPNWKWWNYENIKNTRALSLRDSGNPEEALKEFQKLMGNDKNDPVYIGNAARCLIKMKDYANAEKLLRESLLTLLGETDFTSSSNVGYAYMWLSEVMMAQNKIVEAQAFLMLAEETWKKYSPTLLPNLSNKIDDIYKQMTIERANYIKNSYISQSA
jgi:tetratricopeptide (TPR) repeat protein/Cdc6-like AAA superfamily ATPase